MVQQVNLYLPILRKQKTPFTGLALLQAWLILLFFGGALGAAWVWNLKQASQSLSATLSQQSTELEGLRVALSKDQAVSGTAQSAAEKDLASRRTSLEQRITVRDALLQGHFQPGWGQAARLQMVAQTIPAAAWVTKLVADDRSLEVTGLTLEPAVLTDWVNRLAQSPLLKGQALSTVKVQRLQTDAVLPAAVAAGASSKPVPLKAAAPDVWSYSLVSSMAVKQAHP